MKNEIKYTKPFLSDIPENLKKDILCLLGQNTIQFQFLEKMLKVVIPEIDFKVYYKDLEDKEVFSQTKQLFAEIKKIKEKYFSRINKETLGALVNRFLEIYSLERSDHLEEEVDFDKHTPIFSRAFSIDWALIKGSKKETEKKIAVWKNLVIERNLVVHHLAFEYDLNNPKSCRNLLKHLKKQEAELYGCIQDVCKIMEMVESVVKPLKNLENFRVERPKKFQKLFKIIDVIATNFRMKDSWTPLNEVGKLLRKRALKEFEDYKKEYSCKTLKEVLIKSKRYDLKTENNKVLFRLKSGDRFIN